MLKLRRGVPALLSVTFLALCVYLLFNWMLVFDWFRLLRYEPPYEIAAISSQTTMTAEGQRLFFVHQPEIESDKQSFSEHCNEGEKTIVLGCYIRGVGIYLYDVDDDRLEGVVEVTAAHEMLHAAYDRLKSGERKKVDALLLDAFNKLENERIRSTIEAYRSSDPSSVPNELHSILGSEVRALSPELEAYYSRYFTDRHAVVSLAERYEKEFTQREEQRQQMDEQLSTMRVQIDQLNQSLTVREDVISAEYSELVNLRESGQISAYNARVSQYNRSVNDYNRDVRIVQEMVKRFNEIVEQRNNLVVEENQLIQALDSRSTTIDTQ